ncbi:hypothetical protein K6U06_14805 [Acidiferrimicrobium sp. IK]|uniref:hypothetical protein n=1 Tax=Acidiferrimicrobium sp. IK TaxID=2871700 RepID=UPI0021CB10C4|nr:hypothetical protein [Acidiferrimicrobium sp. IK]MCU4185635.1 hypothetical protein [Acidiferrimicrobium sp. IK]
MLASTVGNATGSNLAAGRAGLACSPYLQLERAEPPLYWVVPSREDGGSGIRRRAPDEGLATSKRTKADEAARYLKNKAPHLDYPTALAAGMIEGACRWAPSRSPRSHSREAAPYRNS